MIRGKKAILGSGPKIFIVFIIMLFMVIITLRDAVKKIPEELYYPFITAKRSNFFMITHIVIPAAAPEIFTAVRLGLATGISVLFIAETFGTVWGLGFFIMDRWMRIDYPAMYSGILMMGIAGLSCAGLVDYLHVKICPWAKLNNNNK
jgi:NitT/TauT family transport system permease protein